MPTPSRQTLTFLMQRFREVGIRPHSKYGQNFLIDLNLLELLPEAAGITSDDVVLEVGTGTGSLTAQLAQRAAAVVTVEVDRQMFQLASEELEPFENITMLQLDALKSKNRLAPQMMQAVGDLLSAVPGRRLKLVANLPYNIATPLMSNLLQEDMPPQSMTVTVQKEVAERVVAKPGTKDYGSLSIWVQAQCQSEILRILPPSAFWPRPKVSSAFLQITLDEVLRSQVPDLAFFHGFLRAMFCHRRKYLRSELQTVCKDQLGKAEVDALLAGLGLDGTIRAEQLDVVAMLALCKAVREATNR